jgi:hypothetical protein
MAHQLPGIDETSLNVFYLKTGVTLKNYLGSITCC